MREIKNYINEKFGRLTVVKYSHTDKNYKKYYICLCDCGNITTVSIGNLKNCIKSCRYLKKELHLKRNIIHNLSNTRFYKIHKSMKERCLNKNNKNFKNYGGRGITIQKDWLNFNNFKNDMYESYLSHIEQYSEKQTTIDRIDVNGNYELNNCRWATCKEQVHNRRRQKSQKEFKAISPEGIEYISDNQMKFAKEHGLYFTYISRCLNKKYGFKSHHKWTFEYI